MKEIKIKIKGKKIQVPESWNEVTLGQYLQMIRVLNNASETKGDLQIMIEIISELFLISREDIMKEDVSVFGEIIEAFKFISSDLPKVESKEEFIINGEKYKFKTDFSKLTVGEMISIETITQNSENIQFEIDKILGILIRKVNKDGTLGDFNAQQLETNIELVRNLNVIDVFEISSRFFFGVKTCIQ